MMAVVALIDACPLEDQEHTSEAGNKNAAHIRSGTVSAEIFFGTPVPHIEPIGSGTVASPRPVAGPGINPDHS
jgi:hypothetical protein